MIGYNIDGSVDCQGDADPTRTLHVPGPKNSAAQLKAVKDFHAVEPPAEEVPHG